MNACKSNEPAFMAVLPPLTQEDQARADLYALIARVLYAEPDLHLLASLAQAGSFASHQADNPLDSAWEGLVTAASESNPEAVREEFAKLFISVGNPAVNPYASFYLAGFMMEKPLAVLRSDLAQLGLARADNVGEPEDHLAALCDTMRALITGAQGFPRKSLQTQRKFFMEHIAPWYARCLDDIRAAESANFYRHVANFAQAFFEIEFQAFEIGDMCDEAMLQ